MTSPVRFLARPDGRIAFTARGTGPLVVLVPGMGDTRDGMEPLAAPLAAAGHRVVVTDVRGHGESDRFARHGDEATAGDVEALIEHLGVPAVVIGNSFGGSAAVIAAARRPDLVTALVLVAPFLGESASPTALRLNRVLYAVLFRRPWGVRFWRGYQTKTLARGLAAPELAAHFGDVAASLARPGRLAQLRSLARQLDHTVVEPFVASVTAPTLVVVGALDPDYPKPAAELERMGTALHAETLLVPDAGHYPHAQRPDLVLPTVLDFVAAHRAARA